MLNGCFPGTSPFSSLRQGLQAHGFGDPALLLSNGPQPTPSPPFPFDVHTKTTMDKLCELVAATAKKIDATTKNIDAYTKANREMVAANATAIHELLAANAMAISHPIAANTTAISHSTVVVWNEINIPPHHGACDGHNHATGRIVPAATSPDPSGIASTAIVSLNPHFPLNDHTTHASLLRAKWQDPMDANIATFTPVKGKLASEEAKMANVPEHLCHIRTTLASNHATGRIAPTVTSSPGPPGGASAAVLSSPACVMKSSTPSTATTSFPTLVMMGGVAPADACPPPAILIKWCCYSSHKPGSGGSFMVNICSSR